MRGVNAYNLFIRGDAGEAEGMFFRESLLSLK